MSFTRFHDDKHRVKKQVEESIYAGDYFINTPGPGVNLPYMEDPHIRLQKWGGNLRNNSTNIENDLRGITRPLNRDELSKEYKRTEPVSELMSYQNVSPYTDESRASHPAWMYKDLEQKRWEHPILNPQNNWEAPFDSNIQSRILEKDLHRPSIPLVDNVNKFYLGNKSVCIGGSNEKICPGTLYENKIQ
jgi:hypothetical protein|tara:strand:- start:27 stop:596 length:570 start_codon:yes stop_codon:yes gene_type:complete